MGLPCCWISTTAPGIRPALISPLMKGSIEASFATDSVAPGGGPKAADDDAAAEAAASNARSNADRPLIRTTVVQCWSAIHVAEVVVLPGRKERCGVAVMAVLRKPDHLASGDAH
jgi:hypothetical protein